MAVKKTQKVSEFKVGGVTIKMGEIYVLDHKFDGSAPNGLKSIEATKFPFSGSGVMDCIAFDETKQLYDTGFYSTSNCLGAYTQEEKDTYVPYYVEYIQKPYEEFRNVQLTPESKNDFWGGYRYEAYVNKEFDTKKPDELFELFQVIMQGLACDKNEKNPFYRLTSQFTISNPQITKNKNKEKAKLRLKTITKFNMLAESDRQKLDLVLHYVGREVTSKISDEDLSIIYFEIINDAKNGLDFAEKFNSALAEYETDMGKTKMEYFSAANKLVKLRKISKTKRGYVTEDGVYLGATLQAVAEFAVQSGSVQQNKMKELIEENPAVQKEV